MTPRDTQRAKVYAAEELVRTLFDRAAEHGNNVVEFFGTQLTLPPEGRFATVTAVQRYVD
ncbi:MAG TPA: TIGR04338 family metallohydrolase, partial [Mycobacterium sp.]|nr:TIGR04338 family metallohydrolase [Mycobacterium sp.]